MQREFARTRPVAAAVGAISAPTGTARLPRLAVFTNPRSRQNRRNPALAAALGRVLGPDDVLYAPQDHAELDVIAARLHAEGVQVIAVNGGDGSAHVVLTAIARAWAGDPLPPLAPLRGGTMNTIAKAVGVRGRPEAILRRLVERLDRGEALPTTERTLMKVTSGQSRPQYGFLFGNGLVSNYLEAYYEGSEPTPTKAIWVLVRGILSGFVNGAFFRRLTRPIDVTVDADGERWAAERYCAIGAGTVDDVGFRFRPFYGALEEPGRVHALGFGCPPLSVIFQLPRIRLAMPCNHPDIRSARVTSLHMRSATPITYMIDGDFHPGAPELRVESGPTLRFVVAIGTPV